MTTLGSTAALAASPAARANGPAAASPTGPVVVFGCADPAAAVRAAGGTVTADLSLISGVAAQLPSGALLTGCEVSANIPLTVSGVADSALGKVRDRVDGIDLLDRAAGVTGTAGAVLSTARQTLGLTASSPTGEGVTVAVIDTGVSDSPDLRGRVLHADMTGSSWNSDRDDYGHGTFVAGLIAGDGTASKGLYQGAAPDARLLDVRVAKDDGATSLIDVLRGLQVVALTQNALKIKVLNLSLSSGSPLPYQIDPLSQALEALWHKGIVVVVPAGNDGPEAGTISSPGNDPTLLTVGALDEESTGRRGDDTVAEFSARGPAEQGVAKPEIVAPGTHLVLAACPRIGHRRPEPGQPHRHRLLPRQRHLDVDGRHLRRRRGPALRPAEAHARPGQVHPDRLLLPQCGAHRPGRGRQRRTRRPGRAQGGRPGRRHRDDAAWPEGQDQIWDRFSAALLSGDRAAAYQWWTKLSPAARSWVARSWTELSPEARSWVARSWTARSWTGDDGTADEWLARSWVARSWVARSWTARSWTELDWVARSWTARSWTARSWIARSWVDDDWVAPAPGSPGAGPPARGRFSTGRDRLHPDTCDTCGS